MTWTNMWSSIVEKWISATCPTPLSVSATSVFSQLIHDTSRTDVILWRGGRRILVPKLLYYEMIDPFLKFVCALIRDINWCLSKNLYHVNKQHKYKIHREIHKLMYSTCHWTDMVKTYKRWGVSNEWHPIASCLLLSITKKIIHTKRDAA